MSLNIKLSSHLKQVTGAISHAPLKEKNFMVKKQACM
jgi:hypothetical protein